SCSIARTRSGASVTSSAPMICGGLSDSFIAFAVGAFAARRFPLCDFAALGAINMLAVGPGVRAGAGALRPQPVPAILLLSPQRRHHIDRRIDDVLDQRRELLVGNLLLIVVLVPIIRTTRSGNDMPEAL